jgi:hypothetical protein
MVQFYDHLKDRSLGTLQVGHVDISHRRGNLFVV